MSLEKEMADFIDKKVAVKTKELEELTKTYKKLIIELIFIVDNNLAYNKEILEQFKEDELAANSIEAEGSVRGLLKTKNDFIDELEETEFIRFINS